VFAAFVFVHGLVHASWLSPAPPAKEGGPAWPFDLTRSRLLSALGAPSEAIHPLGMGLVAMTLVAFALSALGAAGVPGFAGAWAGITTVASLASILLIVTFWNRWFPVGLLLDVALIVTAVGGWWPATLVR
jgi:hypothetical protein